MKTIHELYSQLGATIADILAHKDCPVVIYNQLSDLMVNTENRTPSHQRMVACAHGTFAECLSILTDSPAAIERRQAAA
jgi:hypothetical protein